MRPRRPRHTPDPHAPHVLENLRTIDRKLLALLLAATTAVTGVVATSAAFSLSCRGVPDCLTLGELAAGEPLPEAVRIYDRDGDLIAEVAGPLRRALPAERIPERLAAAYVAVEDRRFWEHGGVDARGVLRAAATNLHEGGISEGASTIPMQLVRTLWAEPLREVGPWRRKVIEARMAPHLIRTLGHEGVLTMYLNSIYLGDGIYGVERAARHYFGVGVDELTLGETALLVGMTRAPEYHDPLDHPDRARAVRDVVLDQLVEAGVVDASEAEAAAEEDLGLADRSEAGASRRRSHLTAAITRELRAVAPDLAGRPGLALHTTIDSRAQQQGRAALDAQLSTIESGAWGPFTADEADPLEGAAVALDPSTGAVRAWIGGRDFARSEFDRVDQAYRQVGSLVKPLLVAASLQRGYGILEMVSADTVPIGTGEEEWLPADHVRETSLPLREALVRSSNRAAAHLGQAIGVEALGEVAVQVGLGRPVPDLASSSIGAFEESLLDMTTAYAVFGNSGLRVTPYLLERVESPDGDVLWQHEAPPPVRAIDEQVAYVVLDAMRAVVDRGTAYSVRSMGFYDSAAGKTGTTNDGRDAWFVGLTPELVTGVWVGFDRPRTIVEGRGGGQLAAPVWASWMKQIGRPRGARDWRPPEGLENVRYDPLTGDVLDRTCEGDLGLDYQRAWVVPGTYQSRSCDRGLSRWYRRFWRAVAR